jgi:serine/threonine protein kinase
MALPHTFRTLREGHWSFIVQPEYWSHALKERVLALVERQAAAKHPQTLELRDAAVSGADHLYLKVFHARRGIVGLKDLFRRSKAFRSLRMNAALADAGFAAPAAIGAGELRVHGRLRRAFILSPAMEGAPAPVFLRNQQGTSARRLALAEKRRALKELALLIRRLHRLGFVHGDLVPSNILVSEIGGAGVRFVFMDNDRTRRFPPWLAQTLWKRNLVQLNRFPLPGISLQDRIRFFRCYRGQRRPRRRDDRLLRRLEMKTRKRRMECDGVDSTGNFRKLMQWQDAAGPRCEPDPVGCGGALTSP